MWNRTPRPFAERYGRGWERIRALILKRDQYLCQCEECKAAGRVRPAHEVDHKVPKFKGGTDAEDNLQAINRECHRRKTQRERGARPKARIGLDGFPVP